MSKAKADPRGWPDYTYPMTIIGQELNVAIDIAAQSLPTLNVSIAASDVTLDVNIASSAVTLNVNIESISEGVTFNVAQSGTWTINAVQTGTWTVNIGAPLDAEGNVETSIVKSVQLDVNIASSTVTLNVNITGQEANINIDIAAQSIAIKGLTDWAAENATDIDLSGVRTADSGAYVYVVDYTVPSGKTLLIYNWDAILESADGQIIGDIFNVTTNTYICYSGGVRGFSVVLSKPIRVPSGQRVVVRLKQDTGVSQTVKAHLGGVLL